MIWARWRVSHHVTIISELAGRVNPFLNIDVLAWKFLNFSLNGILHEMLIFLLLLFVASVIILSDCLLAGHAWWSLHSNAGPLSLLLSLELLVVLLLDSWGPTAVCQVVVHYLTPLALSLYASTSGLACVEALGVFLFLDSDVLKGCILSIVVLLPIGLSEWIESTQRASVERVEAGCATRVNSSCSF